MAGVASTVTVIAEEDDEGGVEVFWVDEGLKVGPEVLEFGDVAVCVAYATDHSWLGLCCCGGGGF